ncbi:hypothetical protein SAMN04488498_11688 [Mesorhizobium albiziae]|uniref:Uncharacterized protein n=1 Tax=Neomesorhizobium albiziae TaxID=335020 RepID=A0A1I4D906_9HYPH|nr:hypothetical protein SAMN04488498_11688 [Mesorhizobium albiziae]
MDRRSSSTGMGLLRAGAPPVFARGATERLAHWPEDRERFSGQCLNLQCESSVAWSAPPYVKGLQRGPLGCYPLRKQPDFCPKPLGVQM